MKHILTLVCLTIGIGATAQEFGQRKGFRGIVTKADKSIELNEVEVSSSLAKTTYAAATRQITVLTAKQIQELPVSNINELLDYLVHEHSALLSYLHESNITKSGSENATSQN